MTRTVGELDHEVDRLTKELTAVCRERNALRDELLRANHRIAEKSGDSTFNTYLRAVIRREFPAALDSDPLAHLADGRIVLVGVDIERSATGAWLMSVWPHRCMRQILRAWQLCSDELERRSFT